MKQIFAIIVNDQTKGYQTTYKELKRRCKKMIMTEKMESYQTTYKELKLITECENLKAELQLSDYL